MKAKDVMTPEVITVTPDTNVETIAKIMVETGISGLPVLDETGKVAGIVSEGDLLRRHELGSDEKRWRRSLWLLLFGDIRKQPREYIRSHAHRASDIMSRDVVWVQEETPLFDIARLLESRGIKRVPVLKDGRLVGIVTRANLIQALAAIGVHAPEPPAEDQVLREKIYDAFAEAGINASFLNVIVHGGKVELWGTVDSEVEQDAARVAVEEVVPRDRIESHIQVMPNSIRASMWAE